MHEPSYSVTLTDRLKKPMGKTHLEWFPLGGGAASDAVLDDERRAAGTPVNPEFDDEDEDKRGVYACATCRCHLTKSTSLVSKEFKGRSGKAFLFDAVVNYVCGPREDRMLITGKHTIADIACVNCSQVLGWHYLHAYNESQRWKVGKFILERALVVKINIVVRERRREGGDVDDEEGDHENGMEDGD